MKEGIDSGSNANMIVGSSVEHERRAIVGEIGALLGNAGPQLGVAPLHVSNMCHNNALDTPSLTGANTFNQRHMRRVFALVKGSVDNRNIGVPKHIAWHDFEIRRIDNPFAVEY